MFTFSPTKVQKSTFIKVQITTKITTLIVKKTPLKQQARIFLSNSTDHKNSWETDLVLHF